MFAFCVLPVSKPTDCGEQWNEEQSPQKGDGKQANEESGKDGNGDPRPTGCTRDNEGRPTD